MAFDASHRPWPLPRGPWVMTQVWEHVLFAHWEVPAAPLRELLPAGVALDTWEGRAFLGIVPFRMCGVRLRGTPPVPGLSRFPELNVRTYVTVGEHPGVLFFSLDAASRLAVAVARRWFDLPYHRADMHLSVGPAAHGAQVQYRSRRTHPGSPPAELAGTYEPTGPAAPAAPGTLEHFLVERYALFTARRDGTIVRGDIHHEPWPLQPATAAFQRNTMAAPLGIELAGVPLLHAARTIQAWVWPPRRVYRPIASAR